MLQFSLFYMWKCRLRDCDVSDLAAKRCACVLTSWVAHCDSAIKLFYMAFSIHSCLRYFEKYPFLIASKKGQFYAPCTLCKSDFSVRSSGTYDCKHHCESVLRRNFEGAPESKSKQRKLSAFVLSTPAANSDDSNIERQITRAEAMICQIIADANLPLTVADTMTAAMKIVFTDSKIAAGKSLWNVWCLFVGLNWLKIQIKLTANLPCQLGSL